MKSDFNEKKFNTLIQKTLLYGVVISVLILIMGLILKDNNILLMGIFIMIITPILRVAMLLYGFLKLGEYNFALASFIVLVLILLPILI